MSISRFLLLLVVGTAIASSAQTLTTLYSFYCNPGCPNGSNPGAALVQATDSNFYGTTSNGGAYTWGTVFKITAAGQLTTLHSFDDTDDGGQPAGLVQGTDGNFYGTTYQGGARRMTGTVFKITSGGHADHTAQLRKAMTAFPRGRAGARHRWELLRNH